MWKHNFPLLFSSAPLFLLMYVYFCHLQNEWVEWMNGICFHFVDCLYVWLSARDRHYMEVNYEKQISFMWLYKWRYDLTIFILYICDYAFLITNSTKLTSSSKSSQKSSKELYREAAEILGITCEFDESCRCIECQVN